MHRWYCPTDNNHSFCQWPKYRRPVKKGYAPIACFINFLGLRTIQKQLENNLHVYNIVIFFFSIILNKTMNTVESLLIMEKWLYLFMFYVIIRIKIIDFSQSLWQDKRNLHSTANPYSVEGNNVSVHVLILFICTLLYSLLQKNI